MTPGEPTDQPAAPDTSDEEELLFHESAALLTAPPAESSGTSKLVWLLVTLAVFASTAQRETATWLGSIVAVLLVHELGHFLGMKWFGYSDVKMFFIPFLGAAVAGRKHAAPAWQQGIVLMLGPIPGIVAGIALYAVARPPMHTWPFELSLMLILLNGFNLLPVTPLDGGRLLDLLLFSRRPWLAVGFQAFGAAALAGMAWLTPGIPRYFLGFLAFALFASLPMRHRRARLERQFRDNPLAMPERIEELDEPRRRELFGWARRLFPKGLIPTPVLVANEMRQLHERMVVRRAGPLAAAALLGVYGGGIAATAVGAVGIFMTARLDGAEELRRAAAGKTPRSAELVAAFDEAVNDVLESERLAGREPAAADEHRREARLRWDDFEAEWNQAPPLDALNAMMTLMRTTKEPERRKYLERLTRMLGREPIPVPPRPEKP